MDLYVLSSNVPSWLSSILESETITRAYRFDEVTTQSPWYWWMTTPPVKEYIEEETRKILNHLNLCRDFVYEGTTDIALILDGRMKIEEDQLTKYIARMNKGLSILALDCECSNFLITRGFAGRVLALLDKAMYVWPETKMTLEKCLRLPEEMEYWNKE